MIRVAFALFLFIPDGLAQKVGLSDPLAAFGGVSSLQGGDYVCHKARSSLPLARERSSEPFVQNLSEYVS